jgi:hypothetical protein
LFVGSASRYCGNEGNAITIDDFILGKGLEMIAHDDFNLLFGQA